MFTGPRQVLSDDIANISCSKLGVDGLLERMNHHLGTSYGLDPGRQSLLEACLRYADDFGFAYAYLRQRWRMDPLLAINDIRKCQGDDDVLRQNAIQGSFIVKDDTIQPRRLWDLWSNRVVPVWMTYASEKPDDGDDDWRHKPRFFAVSHAWLEDDKQKQVLTPINGSEWPVPIPSTTSLERIRTELLHQTTRKMRHKHLHYVWVDVLCLRQKGSADKEQLRTDEWRLDVPIICSIYDKAKIIVYYYAGLGLPFQFGNTRSPRHWLNRAWTQQELKDRDDSYIGGITLKADSPRWRYHKFMLTRPEIADSTDEHVFRETVGSIAKKYKASRSTIFAINEMRKRSFKHAVDRIGGLGYLCHLRNGHTLPIYVEGDDLEDAWYHLVEALNKSSRTELFFYWSKPGLGRENKPTWCPSWREMMDANKEDFPEDTLLVEKGILFDADRNEWWSHHPRIECYIEGFGNNIYDDKRVGTVSTTQSTRGKCTVRATMVHKMALPDGHYTLMVLALHESASEAEAEGDSKDWMDFTMNKGGELWDSYWDMQLIKLSTRDPVRCVVGLVTGDDRFQKITVLDVDGEDSERWKKLPMNRSRMVLA